MKHLNWMPGLGLLGLATTATAAAGREPGARFQTLDTDGDGNISYAEFDAADGGRLARLDRDGNGLLSGRELRPPRAGRPGSPGRGMRRGRRGDANTGQSTQD